MKMSFSNRKKKEKVEKYKEIPFQHLAPIDTVKDKTTFDALDYALSQTNIHNIALTGNYGSGKSSILESYISKKGHFFLIDFLLKAIEKTQIYNWILEKCLSSKNEVSENFGKRIALHYFLKISLATFSTENRENNTEQVDNEKNTEQVEKKELNKDKIEPAAPTENTKATFPETVLQKIEKSILQQILYRKSGVKLPNSRFIRIKRTNRKDAFFTAFVVIALFIVSNYFIHGKIWEFICKPFAIPLDWNDIALSVSLLLALFLFLYKSLIFVKKLRIAKLCFSNAEIEFKGSENEESLLNKYLDELLYFFEETEYNVVIFEDLDRFNNTEIFIKLRELNTLLNNYEKIHRKIVFVYALRDEVFTDNSRTKFFDFIVPVIPVINNQNSGDVLYNYWEKNRDSALGKVDGNFLQDIGLFVDDMRLLKNSINEFKIYDKKVNEDDYTENEQDDEAKESHDRNKIFALILYKNLYPKDFALLAQNKGELYGIFEKKKDVAEKEKVKIEQEIVQLEAKIKDIESQVEVDIQELRTIYVAKVFSKKPKNNTYITNDVSDFLSDEGFQKIQLGNSLPCVVPGYSGNNRGSFKYDFWAIEKEVNSLYSYKEREEMLKKKLNGGIESLKQQVSGKKALLSNIQQMSIEEMLNEFPSEQFVADVKNIDKNFIIYLLRYGYIDENYFEYISYFYAYSLSEQEKQYLLLIKNRQEPNFDLLINNTNFGNVVARIKDTEWKLPSVLNYSMLYCIIAFDDSHIDLYLRALWKYKLFNRNSLFLSKFNADSYIQSKLYQRLYDLFRNEGNWLDKLFSDEKTNVLYNLFIYVDFEKTENDVITFLTNDVSYLHRIDIDKDAIASKINYYGLKFNLLEDTVNYPVYDVLLDNNAYIVSKNNFDIIIKQANGDAIEEPIKDYYTQISKIKNQNIKAYVDKNIESFVNDFVLSTGDSTTENEEAFIELLNNENLMTETKAELIEKNNCVVSDIAQIKGVEIQLADGENKSIDIRNLLYKCKKVSPTWQNIYENFKYNGNKLDTCLIDYLNDDGIVDELTSKDPLTREELKDENGNYDIASKVYHEVLYSKDLSLEGYIKLMDVCPWNYKSLGKYDIDFTKIDVLINLEKLSLTSENYSGIKQNHQSLLSKFISRNFDEFINKKDELKIEITPDDMKSLLDSKEFNKEQKSKLLSGNFDIWNTISQKESYVWLGKKIVELEFSGQLTVPVAAVVRNLDDEEDLVKIIVLQGRYLKASDITNAINNKMGEVFKSCIIREGKQKNLPNNVDTRNLCTILQEKGLISSFKEDGDKIRIQQKRSNT